MMIQGIVNVKANVHECPWFGEKTQPKPPKVPHPSCNVDAFALAFSKALGHKRRTLTPSRSHQNSQWIPWILVPKCPQQWENHAV